MSESAWNGRHRFFVVPEAIRGDIVQFSREQSHQLARVLRVGLREPVVILTGDGQEYLVELSDIDPKASSGQLVDRRSAPGSPRLAISLYQSMLPRERFELALTKATEVGVGRFIPLITQRTIARVQERDWAGREKRLQAIAREAAEQSERAVVPMISPPIDCTQAVKQACADGPALIAWERGDHSMSRDALRELVRDPGRVVSILVGPEGGFSVEEICAAKELGANLVWLGPRILRAETAGLVLASILLYESGDLGFPA
jgi:16S rRNA (uracil1498-N3)-methyltransferase